MIRSVRWLWPSVIIASTAITNILVFADVTSPVRSVIAIWFLFICPGMALSRLLRLADGWSELTLALALSFTLGLLVNMVLMYAGRWSYTTGLLILSLVSVVGSLLQLTWSPSESPTVALPTNNTNQRLNIHAPAQAGTAVNDAE